MRAWILESLGGLEKLTLADVPDPTPAAGEVVLGMISAGLNPADRYLAEGHYPRGTNVPAHLGRDGIGMIETLGAGVTEFKQGEKASIVHSEIGVSRNGTFAERVAVPVESLVTPPPEWRGQSDPPARRWFI